MAHYKHLVLDQLVFIERKLADGKRPIDVARDLGVAYSTVYRVRKKLALGFDARAIYEQYKRNKRRCGSKIKRLTAEQHKFVESMLDDGLSINVIATRFREFLGCCPKTLYRMAESGEFNAAPRRSRSRKAAVCAGNPAPAPIEGAEAAQGSEEERRARRIASRRAKIEDVDFSLFRAGSNLS